MAIRLTRAINYALSRCVQWNVQTQRPSWTIINHDALLALSTLRRFSFASSSLQPLLLRRLLSFLSLSLSLCCCASSCSRCCCISRKPLPSQIIMSMAGVGQARLVCPQAAVCRRCSPSLPRPALPPFPSCLLLVRQNAHSPFWASQRAVPRC